MFPFTYRHLLSLLLMAASAVLVNAQTSKPLNPGTRLKVQNCQKVEMQAIQSGRLEILAKPMLGERVMGYTDQPVPANVEIPSNMQHWLESVEQGAAYVEAHPETNMGNASASQSYPVIEPLLGGISWDQSYPYDQYCPKGTPVGCVATALAQVMRFWQYPDQGIGSHTWEWNGITHHVDFDSTTYHWDLMFSGYNRWATEEQMNEVAKLSYHCGVAINMMWETEGSGTWTQLIPTAIKKYFGYNDRAACVSRTCYTHEEWNELITKELLAGRPVIYSGSSDEGGHAFVIDGRDARGLYHVNWGWGGYYNGYFDICILNPTGTGIGATDSELGFCMSQDAVVQICPEKGVGEPIAPVKFNGIAFSNDSLTIAAGAYVENYTNDTLKGMPGIQVYDSLDQVVLTNLGNKVTLYPFGTLEYWAWKVYFGEFTVYTYADSLADGTYYTKPCYLALGADTVLYEATANAYMNPRVEFTVEGGKFTSFQGHADEGNIIEGKNFSLQRQELAAGKTYEATIDIVNRGNDHFFGCVYLEIQTSYGRKSDIDPIYADNIQVTLSAGDSTTLTFPINIDATGNWLAVLRAQNFNMDYTMENCPMDSTIYFSTALNEESPAALKLNEEVQLLTERCEVDGEIEFQLVVQNKGGNFSDLIGMQFYSSKTASGNPAFSIENESQVSMNSEADTVIVKGVLSEAKGMKKYYALPFYRDHNGEAQIINYIDSNDKESKPTPIEVRVYNATGIETITADDNPDASDGNTYDLFGRPAKDQGSFIIRKGKKIVRQL